MSYGHTILGVIILSYTGYLMGCQEKVWFVPLIRQAKVHAGFSEFILHIFSRTINHSHWSNVCTYY